MMDLRSRFLRVGFDFMVRRSLRGVWLRGPLPEGGFVWAANHHSWWDAFVAVVVLWRAGREVTVLVDPLNVASFRFLRGLGVLGTNEMRTATTRLRDGHVVVIFPEGELGPATSPRPLMRGAAWLAETAPAPLAAVAVRLVMRGNEAPEAYIDAHVVNPYDLQAALTEQLAALDASLAASDPRTPLPGFARLVRGRRSWDERLSGQRP